MALKVSDWSQFISLVAQPLEYRLGRALHDSGKIRAEVGIDMNELEIIRAISGQITQHGSLSDAQKSIRSRFGAYLEFLEQTDPEILKKLEYVLDPAKENVLPGRVVSRNGMRLACEQKRGGAPQYDVQIVPSNNYGNLPRATPTAAYEGLLRARLNEGKPIAPMHILLDTGETIGELSSHGAWIISGGTMQASDTALPDGYFNLSRGRERRDATVYGRGPQSSFVVVSGGVHDNKITQAIEYQIVTPKLLDVLESNKKRGLPKRTVKLYVTSDWQIGSPTMKPAMILSGLIDAIKGGCEEILINGDISQGMNYLRYTQEAQLVEHPLNGIDSQARFIYYLLEPAIDYAWKRAKKDQNFKLPRWRIVPGNHETNSQANKGLQGTWFVHPFAEKIKENYAARLDDREKANTYVICPEKYIDHDGTQVDYPLLYVNKTEETGICIQMTHYNNSGSKGSSFAPTVSKVANAVHSLGAVEPHIRIESHMHVSGFQVRNGVVAVRTGANATGSAFEQHLLYENCPESNLHITLDSHDVPRFFVATRAYQETRDAALMAELHKHGVLLKYESFEKYCLDKRQEVSPKNGGNPTNLMTEQFHGPHKRGSVIPTRGTH
jgi:hypothetical protein